ncbi:thiamine pyrophosphate-binding protein [Paenibacillus chartarius]|uniref:Thiamine pyrophosphate-binding protein n=1 Tax=Paenibacillus chartarius TaxID=747481 RepID=A0ABV6DMW7_9BACL
MRAIQAVIDYVRQGGVRYVFGIPAGSVNAFYDYLYELTDLTPVIAKHEGAAGYMAAAYAKYSGKLALCIGCSGPGSTNLLTAAANAMREHLPVLFLTGSVPTKTVGLNASQELDAVPSFSALVKSSVSVSKPEELLPAVVHAVETALGGVPGPVHVAMPIDMQLADIPPPAIPLFPAVKPMLPTSAQIQMTVGEIVACGRGRGFVFVGQGARNSVEEVLQLAELLEWPIVATPQAKGLIPDSHPLYRGVFGFAGHESASGIVSSEAYEAVFVIGSSLGETATSNWKPELTEGRCVIQLDYDETVFDRHYRTNIRLCGEAGETLRLLLDELEQQPSLLRTASAAASPKRDGGFYPAIRSGMYDTPNVLLELQRCLAASTVYSVDIGEFMSYVIHHMRVLEPRSFDLNVHFGAMGTAIGTAIGMQLAAPERPVVCITGDGCFFMHGMEILTAKEYNLPILFVVMNNARLGMVHHGHSLQYKRVHPRFSQEPVNLAAAAEALGIPSYRIERLQDITAGSIAKLQHDLSGPALLEISLVDNQVPPMGDRVKFLSSFK